MNKKELRKKFLEKRRLLTAQQVHEDSLELAKLFLAAFDFSKVNFIHTFLPIDKQNEVNTTFIIDHIRANFPQVKFVVPKIDSSSSALQHCLFHPHTQLQQNAWGIPEPVTSELVQPSDLDMVLVPLLAFDMDGNRIGYGKGFYDQFLAQCKTNTLKIGLSLFPALETNIENVEPHDVRLDFCVTPQYLINF